MKRSVSLRSNVLRLTLSAMMIALFVVLSMVPSEISWASLVALVCAFLLGPAETMTVVIFGSLIEQMWYGLNWYALLWMLPWVLFGICCGFGALWSRRSPKVWKTILVVVASEIILNVANTSVLCYFGYVAIDFSQAPHLIIWAYLLRMPHALIRSALSAVAIPLLIPRLRRVLSRHMAISPKNDSKKESKNAK